LHSIELVDVEILDKVKTTNKIILGPREALQLIFGYRDILELLGSIKVQGEVGLLSKLFPRNIPYV